MHLLFHRKGNHSDFIFIFSLYLSMTMVLTEAEEANMMNLLRLFSSVLVLRGYTIKF